MSICSLRKGYFFHEARMILLNYGAVASGFNPEDLDIPMRRFLCHSYALIIFRLYALNLFNIQAFKSFMVIWIKVKVIKERTIIARGNE